MPAGSVRGRLVATHNCQLSTDHSSQSSSPRLVNVPPAVRLALDGLHGALTRRSAVLSRAGRSATRQRKACLPQEERRLMLLRSGWAERSPMLIGPSLGEARMRPDCWCKDPARPFSALVELRPADMRDREANRRGH